MKLIIDISEEEYKEVLEDTYSGTSYENKIFTVIANGTPYEERSQGEWGKWIITEIRCPNCLTYFQADVYATEELNRCPICSADMMENPKYG